MHDFISFLIDPPFSHIYLLFMFIFIYLFVLTYCLFFYVTKVLSIDSPVTPPFQKLCENCHVVNVIISPMGGVHSNVGFQEDIQQFIPQVKTSLKGESLIVPLAIILSDND
jgi:hypothetical protein